MRKNNLITAFVAGLLALLAAPASGQLTTVREITHLAGESEYVLRGLGLVVGLNGTGDSGDSVAMIAPLARVLENSGNAVPGLEALSSTNSVALVMVTCAIPRGGAALNDAIDVRVAVIGNASSLAGGELFVTLLRGPEPGDPVFATAFGSVSVDDAEAAPTVGTVREGAKITRPIELDPPGAVFDLTVKPWYRGYSAVAQIAAAINDEYLPTAAGGADRIARAMSDRTVRVIVPDRDRAEPAAFIADVLSTPVNPALLDLPPRVIVNSRSGTILVSGDVRISPVAITHNGLTITTTTPPPLATPADPLVETSQWGQLQTDADEVEQARLADLQATFRQLDVPAQDQIAVLQMLKKMGHLHAELIID
ncbi:MAG: flagellar basal body P-ring protein FlgI [Planctomycetota bacterium]